MPKLRVIIASDGAPSMPMLAGARDDDADGAVPPQVLPPVIQKVDPEAAKALEAEAAQKFQ